MLQNQNFYHDYAYLKKLGDSYKLVKCNQVFIKGLERCDVYKTDDVFYRRVGRRWEVFDCSKTLANMSCVGVSNGKVKDTTNEEKLTNNICRARNKVLEYVLCNDFNFFVTLTLDPEKYDRQNLKKFQTDFSSFVRNYNMRKNANLKYLLVPETHEDGSWHMHGFFMGLPYDRLELFDIHGERPLPKYIVDKRKNNELVFNFPAYEKHFGYNVIEPIRNKKQAALYMSKYLTKDISRNVTDLGCHLYYCSKGLNKAEVIKQGQFLDYKFEFDFSNQFGGQSFFDILSEEQLDILKDKIGGNPLTLDDYKRGYKKENDGWQAFMDVDTGEIIGGGLSEVIM